MASALLKLLSSRCLVSDDTVNPYTWLLVDENSVSTVHVDAAALEEDALVLAP